ncbi:hypothetical protein GA0115240_114927 [Streptomyces sp. DvalAA-14]|uniref:hypothetical protein n=1 Tax=unclassified Streptomyces TaxID=2593676 RepID=UPI00081B2557|nr:MULTISPECIES: hypothetical protein [unclassified Streptomyces]MYS19937.1 hypothetical protein [Streptomyces sp. SID4948]SCD56836.1 hypothetical protein GA0115240_114927 [Streptomyces sp. DvalAA-14]
MPSLRTRTALVLTATAAVAALPAVAAVAASSGPLPAAADALPTSTVTDALPAQALPTQYVTGALGYGIAAVRDLRIDPLSNTGVDPLTNGVGSQIADFRPVSTTAATAPITNGGSLGTLPLVGPLTGLLPH